MNKMKYYLALSRTPHGILDMATPALAALLWHGSIPPVRIILLGLITAFAGYTAVYALNDLVDYRHDRKKMEQGGFGQVGADLDAVMVRHPLAQGLLSVQGALLWTSVWAIIALAGAFLLNPFCVVVFLCAALLETLYCLLWDTSPFRTLASGTVKTAGPMAAAFAVDPHPSPVFLLTLFLWLFFWEIGGQNVPNDWTDLEEDRRFKAKTIPVQLGTHWAGTIIFWSLVLAVVLNGLLMSLTRIGVEILAMPLSMGAGFFLLLLPAYRLLKTGGRRQALVLFNRASYYPLTLLLINSLAVLV
ncbi:MAG TPA: UbiA family prenyltransferase [Thermodesulfobacteriota bacterium]|nr:UbiA family prenyltransferase [Thermodesulfobacteriota bacterium]